MAPITQQHPFIFQTLLYTEKFRDNGIYYGYRKTFHSFNEHGSKTSQAFGLDMRLQLLKTAFFNDQFWNEYGFPFVKKIHVLIFKKETNLNNKFRRKKRKRFFNRQRGYKPKLPAKKKVMKNLILEVQ